MINLKNVKKICKDDISLIENYEKAINDKTQTWHCHHRRETIYSRSGLIEIGEYYNRPACELILLTKSEHMKLHQLGKHLSEDTRRKLSEANKGKSSGMKGKHHTEDTRRKLSETKKGKHLSEETRKKMSESHKGKPAWMKGKHHSEESCKKMSEAKKGENNPRFGKPAWNNGKHHSAESLKKMSEALKGEKCYIFGKHHSDETRKKMSESHKGKHWYNNGETSIQTETCPEGFVKGRIKK